VNPTRLPGLLHPLDIRLQRRTFRLASGLAALNSTNPVAGNARLAINMEVAPLAAPMEAKAMHTRESLERSPS
jgi:hypothetical protein